MIISNKTLVNLQTDLVKQQELKPVNRVVVIWKDVLGYKIHDNIPVSDYTYEEIYKELVCAMARWDGTQAINGFCL